MFPYRKTKGGNYMKKRLPILAVLLSLALLTACGGHRHESAEGWQCDGERHWRVCGECGETFDEGAHDAENGTCSVCASEVSVFEDGSINLTTYNEHGDCIATILYNDDGTVAYTERNEYEYDGEGNKTLQRLYTDEVLFAEFTYARSGSGEEYTAGETYYYEDGSKSVTEYDELWNVLYSAWYTSENELETESRYVYGKDGSVLETEYFAGVLTAERSYVTDAEGLLRIVGWTSYNEDGSGVYCEYDEYDSEVLERYFDAAGKTELEKRHEYTYDSDGNKTYVKSYEDGRLAEETEYAFADDGMGGYFMNAKTILYHADGSKSVTENDPLWAWSVQTDYDAAGNVTNELRYAYTYDENGNMTRSECYENGRLAEERLLTLRADGETERVEEISYHADGGKTVKEFDGNMELVQETVYDASGNAVKTS